MIGGLGSYLVSVEDVNGSVYTFDGNTQLRILTGRSAPETRTASSALPLQNYSRVEYNAFLPRRLTAVLQVLGEDAAHMWKCRQDMYRVFNPFKGPFTLHVTYPQKGVTYTAYNVMLSDAMDSPLDTKRDPRYSEFALSMTALDPFWYGTHHVVQYTGFTGTPGAISTTLTLTAGNYWASPLVRFYGPFTAIAIFNTIWKNVTPKKLDVRMALAAGQSLSVDCRFKRVTSTVTPELALWHDSNLNTFGLIPESLGSGGVNNLDIYSFGYTANTIVQVEWDDTYYAI